MGKVAVNVRLDNRPILVALLKAKAKSYGYHWGKIKDNNDVIKFLITDIQNDLSRHYGANTINRLLNS